MVPCLAIPSCISEPKGHQVGQRHPFEHFLGQSIQIISAILLCAQKKNVCANTLRAVLRVIMSLPKTA